MNNRKPLHSKPNKAQKKKASRGSIIIASIGILVFIAIIISIIQQKVSDESISIQPSEFQSSSSSTNENIDSEIVINISDIGSKAKFYSAKIDGTTMEVLAVKASDGSIRTAFNTCQVCYSSGRGFYVQEGDALVCQNCGNRFKTNQVEIAKGGCNPVPIFSEDKIITESTITIPIKTLAKAKTIFSQ